MSLKIQLLQVRYQFQKEALCFIPASPPFLMILKWSDFYNNPPPQKKKLYHVQDVGHPFVKQYWDLRIENSPILLSLVRMLSVIHHYLEE